MIRFGIICPELSGHLNPMMALARALQSRGHSVAFFQRPMSQAKVESAGFACRTFGEAEFPTERMRAELAELARLSGIGALRYTIDLFRRRIEVCLRDVPDAARSLGIDALLVDETNWEGATIAERLGVPFVTVSNALCLRSEPGIPPFFTSWAYRDTLLGRLRNRLAYRFFSRMARPILAAVNAHRAGLGLSQYRRGDEICSPLLLISQQPPEFDFPRRDPPPQLRYVGPMVDAQVRGEIPFPFERLDGKPLIYASLGTLQNDQRRMFSCIASACEGLDVQLVVSLGGGSTPEALGPLPGSPIVVEFAPQLELVRRSALCITHAGLNTALESMAAGVPMVAIPITNDQPGVAARIAWTGCGEVVPLGKLTPPRLRTAVERVLRDGSHARSAARMKAAIAECGGARAAADLIEAALC
jgi:zeaxanthin glucosyltransferase